MSALRGRADLAGRPVTTANDPKRCRRGLTANSFSGALRRGSRSRLALRRRLCVTDRQGLRVADRLGQHLMQLSLGRCGGFCHFATISLSTSRLPSPTARPSIVHNFSRRLPALLRIPLPPSVYGRAEKSFPLLVD